MGGWVGGATKWLRERVRAREAELAEERRRVARGIQRGFWVLASKNLGRGSPRARRAYRVFADPTEMLAHLDELGVR